MAAQVIIFDELMGFVILLPNELEHWKHLRKRKHRMKSRINEREQAVQNYKISTQTCSASSGQHKIYTCEKFKTMDPIERRNLALKGKLCFNCLNTGHITKDCPSKSSCRKCDKRQNTLLHLEREESTSKDKQHTNLHHSTAKFNSVLLPTAIVPVMASDGSIVKCRALLNTGAQLSMMTEEFAQRLKLERSPSEMNLNRIVSSKTISSSMVNFQIRTINSQSITRTFECKRSLQSQSLKLADPDFRKSRKVDIILGSYVYELVVLDGKLEENNMHLRNSIFWMDSSWKHR